MSNVSMPSKPIFSPQYRNNIKGSFINLANKDWQMKEWLGKDGTYWYFLKYYVLGTILDDHELHDSECFQEVIDDIFYNDQEAYKVHTYSFFLKHLLIDKIGCGQPNSAYLEHPEWPKVWQGAKEIYEMMDENDKKYGFDDCLSAFNNSNYDEWCKRFDGET